MAYTIQALVAKRGILNAMHFQNGVIIELEGDFDMLPLTEKVRRYLSLDYLPLTHGGLPEFPKEIAAQIEHASQFGPIVYIEAEYFGGDGTQANVMFDTGKSTQVRVSDNAINLALRFIGVVTKPGVDEFQTVGLDKHRQTDRWVGVS